MGDEITELFNRSCDLESFKELIYPLNGDFNFLTDEMISLGRAYFERYPDTFSGRNTPEVILGYRIIRVCILEKAVSTFDESCKSPLRSIFFSSAGIAPWIEQMSETAGYSELNNLICTIKSRIDEIRLEIDSIPAGMIKERYIGAITNFYNIIYLLEAGLEKSSEKIR